jgi:hypothetical protein
MGNYVIGKYLGGGVGLFGSDDARSISDLAGPFQQGALDTTIGSASLAWTGSTHVASVYPGVWGKTLAGPGAISMYETNTITTNDLQLWSLAPSTALGGAHPPAPK